MNDMLYRSTNHPTIGPIRGITKVSGVNQYLGIQYATLKDRFARGELLEAYPTNHANKRDGVLDATKLGPIPLSPANGCEWEQKLIQKALPFPDYPQSDIDCLTLNIAVPNFKEGKRMPVLALVHGGAFATGSSSYPQYDLALITKMSVETGMPMIAVGINYRLGVPGFLYSSELKAAGYKPNNGLDDQRLALRWIKHHIEGFGGNPDSVTFIGESAGGASGCFHLHSPEPLFHQLIAMSGTSLLRPRKPELLQKSFGRVAEILGVANLSPEEQIQKLLHISLDELRAKVGRQISMGPMVDSEMIPEMTTFEGLGDRKEVERVFPGMKYCRRIIMGDCEMDSMAFASRIATRTDIFPKTLVQHLHALLDPIDLTLAPKIVSAYSLNTSIPSNTPESTKSILEFGHDVCFALAARSFTRAWSAPGTEALLYRFNCPNPWDGPWKGVATHIQDIVFMLLNYRESLAPGQRKSAERFAQDIIAFVAGGKTPWKGYRSGVDEGSMVYFAPMEGEEDESGFVGDEKPGRTGRRDVLLRLGEERGQVWDRIMDAWQMFMAGPPQ